MHAGKQHNADYRQRILHPINWFISRLPADSDKVILDRKRIYIVPSRLGYLFGLILVVMLLASINYQTNLGFMLSFLLAAMVMVIMLHTFANLRQLQIQTLKAKNVFAGEVARFPVKLSALAQNAHYNLHIEYDGGKTAAVNILPSGHRTLHINPDTSKRGKCAFPQFRVASLFPFGWFYCWCLIRPAAHIWVYPRPAPQPLPLPASVATTASNKKGTLSGKGNEDFYCIRDYQQGDHIRQIHWKSYAKGQDLQSKEFVSEMHSELWLDEAMLPKLPTEQKLSHLCRWIIDAEKAGMSYGLKLKNLEIAPDKGKSHQHKCLQALAAYPYD